jgi:taurine dioxygenase
LTHSPAPLNVRARRSRRCVIPRSKFTRSPATVGFEGGTEAESKPLLDYLLEHGHRPEFTCRFRWVIGSIAFWDNRCTKHLAVHDAGPFRRIMRRTQIVGDRVF